MKNYHFYGNMNYASPFTGKMKTKRVAISAILTEDILTIGVATCDPKDKYVKQLGRAISLGRAKKNPIEKINIEFGQIAGKEFVKWCENYLNQNNPVEEEMIHADSNHYRDRYDNIGEY